ncbi:MAG: peptide deformylase [Pseudomonadota bacterium]|jgi:peptide deformylase
MAQRTIVEYPAAVLKQRCAEVEDFDDELATLIDDMRETMVDAEGLGLAANQVGVSLRVFTMLDAVEGDDPEATEVVELVNPVIVARRGEIRFEEGCLSFPGISENVLRSAEVDVTFRNRDGSEQQRTFRGVSAVCVQHELDHLDGVTFLDRLSPLKRRLALRSFTRSQEARRWEAIEEQRSLVRGR